MRTHHDAHDEQRHADELRARLDISYEDALRHAVDTDLTYPEAVRELAAEKGRKRRGRRAG